MTEIYAVLAVTLNLMLGLLLEATHPLAAAMTLLVALGRFKLTFHNVTVVSDVLIFSIISEGLRQVRSR